MQGSTELGEFCRSLNFQTIWLSFACLRARELFWKFSVWAGRVLLIFGTAFFLFEVLVAGGSHLM